MQTENPILFFSGVLLSALHIYFIINPLKLVELNAKAYFGFIVAGVFMLWLKADGVFLFAGLSMWMIVVALTIQRIPVVRIIEPHTGNGVVMIHRIIDRHYWPLSTLVTTAYRRGKFLGFLPWIDASIGFHYLHQGKTYTSLKEFARAFPEKVGIAEDALNKSLGTIGK